MVLLRWMFADGSRTKSRRRDVTANILHMDDLGRWFPLKAVEPVDVSLLSQHARRTIQFPLSLSPSPSSFYSPLL
jgi:hypothetical protein